MHSLKYKGFTKIFQYLLGPSLSNLKPILKENSIDFIVPVPLHKIKKRERGFNQAYKICEIILNELKYPIIDFLSRDVWIESQTTLSISDRKMNIQNANYLIIDDVLTIGSTANECAKIIKENSNSKVGVFTIAAAE